MAILQNAYFNTPVAGDSSDPGGGITTIFLTKRNAAKVDDLKKRSETHF
jgi:hypothetical protein